MAKDFDLDWTTFAGQTGTDLRNTDSRAGKAVEAAATGGTGDRLNLTQDVTDAVKAIFAEGQNYIIFQWTGNAGGADLYGKGSNNAPTLAIETANAASQTKYTVKYTDGTNDLKDPVEYDGTIGDDVNASDADKASFRNADGTKKYIYESGAEAITLVGDASSNVITLVFREASEYSYTLWGRYGENSKKLSTNFGFENDEITYYYPQFVLDGTTLYVKKQNSSNPYWGGTTTLGGDMTIDVNYSDGTIEDVVFYKEAEEMEGFTAKTTNNATIRCSNGTGGIVTETDALVELVTLPAGNYKITGQVWGTNNLTAGVKANDEDVWTLASTGSIVSSNATFKLEEETTLYVYTTGGTDNRMLDYIYIQKMKDTFSYTVNYVDEDNNVLGTNTQTAYEGDVLNIAWSKYIKVDDQWYVTDENEFKVDATEAGEKNVVYKTADIAYFFEMESLNRNGGSYLEEVGEKYSNGGRLRLSKGSLYYTSALAEGVYALNIAWENGNSSASEVYVYTRDAEGNLSDKLATFIASKGSGVFAATINVPDGHSIAFNGNEGGSSNNNARMDYMTLTEGVAVNISKAGYATFCSPFAVDFAGSGITAYLATVADEEVSFEATEKVPANTGVLLKGNTGNYVVPTTTGATGTSALIGVTEDTQLDAGIYVLMNSSEGVGFYKTTNQFTVGANTAYLPAQASAREFIAIDGEATGISAVNAEQQGAEVYNLNGQRVSKAQKGLYIQNGKKVIMK